MEAEALKGAVKTKKKKKNGGYGGDAAALSPPSVTRLKLSDQRGEKQRQPLRWTDNMQHSANAYPFSYLAAQPPHNEDITHRTDLRESHKSN